MHDIDIGVPKWLNNYNYRCCKRVKGKGQR